MILKSAYGGVQRDIELVSEVLTGERARCATMSAGRLIPTGFKEYSVRCAFLVRMRYSLPQLIVAPMLPIREGGDGVWVIPDERVVTIRVNDCEFTLCWYVTKDVRYVRIHSGPYTAKGHIVGHGPLYGERSFVVVE